MNLIKVDRKQLLDVASKNFEDYEELYDASLESFSLAYRDKAEEYTKKFLSELHDYKGKILEDFESEGLKTVDNSLWSDAEAISEFNQFVYENKPADQRSVFKDEIEMLELDVRDEIDITKDQYDKLYKNRWPFLEQELRKVKNVYAHVSGCMGLSGSTGSSGSQGSAGLTLSRVENSLSKFNK